MTAPTPPETPPGNRKDPFVSQRGGSGPVSARCADKACKVDHSQAARHDAAVLKWAADTLAGGKGRVGARLAGAARLDVLAAEAAEEAKGR